MFLIVHTEVPYKKDSLMEELLAILLLIWGSLYCIEKNVVKKMIELLLNLILTHYLLGKAVVHAEYVIYDLDRSYCET